MYQLLRQAARRHQVHLATLVPDRAGPEAAAALAPLRELCDVTTVPTVAHTPVRRLRSLAFTNLPDMAVRGMQPELGEAVAALLAAHRFDVVQAESIEMVQYGRGGSSHRAPPGAATGDRQPLWCYDAFNAEYLLQFRAFRADLPHPARAAGAAYSLAQWQRLRRYEQRLSHAFDLALAVSEGDRRALNRLDPELRIKVIPNGVDTQLFDRHAAGSRHAPCPGPNAPFILFTGTLDFRPNVDAATWFVRAIWPMLHARRPELRLCVVGQRPVRAIQVLEAVAGVQIIGPVEDVRPWFAHARAYVLPMRVGGGVRLKLLEALAMELPCVTTRLGAEGVMGFTAGEHALVADDPALFVDAVERLLDDQALSSRLAAAGRRLAVERYDWRPIVEAMEQAWAAGIESMTKPG